MTNSERLYVRDIVYTLAWRRNRGNYERKILRYCRELLGTTDYEASVVEAKFQAKQKKEAKNATA